MIDQPMPVGHVGEFFRKYRKAHDITQVRLAERLEVGFDYVARTETGTIKNPRALIKRLYMILNSDEREELVKAIRADMIEELNKFIEEIQS